MNVIEYGKHVLIDCPLYYKVRQELLTEVQYQSFHDFDTENKLKINLSEKYIVKK
jgi:hypothetical protein